MVGLCPGDGKKGTWNNNSNWTTQIIGSASGGPSLTGDTPCLSAKFFEQRNFRVVAFVGPWGLPSLKTNSSPLKIGYLNRKFHLPIINFQGLCHVSFREGRGFGGLGGLGWMVNISSTCFFEKHQKNGKFINGWLSIGWFSPIFLRRKWLGNHHDSIHLLTKLLWLAMGNPGTQAGQL